MHGQNHCTHERGLLALDPVLCGHREIIRKTAFSRLHFTKFSPAARTEGYLAAAADADSMSAVKSVTILNAILDPGKYGAPPGDAVRHSVGEVIKKENFHTFLFFLFILSGK